MTEVVAIAAVGLNGVIGSGNDIPWRIAEDWHRFKALTTGHVLLMGRKTYESIGRPLPGRTTIVLTRDATWHPEEVRVVPTVSEAFSVVADLAPETLFVAGGGEIYRATWDHLDRLEITQVDLAPEGDVTFPVVDPAEWTEVARKERDGFRYLSYQRCRSSAV